MNVWLIDPYGPLPGEQWRDYRLTMVLQALVERGHHVTWWTAGFDHFTKKTRATDWTTISIGEQSAIRLVPTPAYRRNVSLARLWFEIVFAWRVFRNARLQAKPDVIVAEDPPQANGVAAILLARRFRVPAVLDCLDLWPEIFAGALPAFLRVISGPVFALLYRVRSWTYSHATAAVAACDTYRDRLLATVPNLRPEQITTVFLGISVNDVAPQASDSSMRRAVEKEPGEFRVIYAGTLGTNYDIGTVLDAARILLPNPRVRFVIAGDGPMRDAVISRIHDEKLDNTTYLGRIPTTDLGPWYAAADVALIPYTSWSTVAMPVKLFDYLAAGLPVISSLVGELSQLMERCGFGISYRSGDAQSLADAIESVARDDRGRSTMAQNARRTARQFDRNEQYGKFAGIVERVVSAHPSHDGR